LFRTKSTYFKAKIIIIKKVFFIFDTKEENV